MSNILRISTFIFFLLLFLCQANGQVTNYTALVDSKRLPDNISLTYKYISTADGEESQQENYLLWDIKNRRIKSIKVSDDSEEKQASIYIFVFANGIQRLGGGRESYLKEKYTPDTFFSPFWELKKTKGGTFHILSADYLSVNEPYFYSVFSIGERLKQGGVTWDMIHAQKTTVIGGIPIPTEIIGSGNYSINPNTGEREPVKKQFRLSVNVESIKINQKLDDKMFTLRVPVGANVVDEIRGIAYRADGLENDRHHVKIGEVLEDVLKEAEEQKGTSVKSKK